jgi:hypothetical protein
MSDQTASGGEQNGDTPNKAQSEFERYKARLATAAPAGAFMPQWGAAPWGMPPGGMLQGGVPGWALPPSVAAMGQAMPGPYPTAAPRPGYGGPSIAGQLGETLRLGIQLLNAALSSGVNAMSMAVPGGDWPYHGGAYGCGCGCSCSCGCSCCEPACECPSCCEQMGCSSCCSPSAHGCC